MFCSKTALFGLALFAAPVTATFANTLPPEDLAWYLRPLTQAEKTEDYVYRVQYVEMTLRYRDTVFRDGDVWSPARDEFGGSFDSLSSADDPWGIPLPHTLTAGTKLRFSALLYTEYPPRDMPDTSTYIVLMQCELETIGCDDYVGAYSDDNWDLEHWYEFGDDSFGFSYWDDVISGEMKIGGGFSYEEWYPTGSPQFIAKDGTPAMAHFLAWSADFDVVDYTYVSAGNWDYVPTIPAPAAALLLPSGLIALAGLRRRGRG